MIGKNTFSGGACPALREINALRKINALRGI